MLTLYTLGGKKVQAKNACKYASGTDGKKKQDTRISKKKVLYYFREPEK